MASERPSPARPLSPHLQIYKPQITSGTSIFHRFTGIGLAVGTVVLVWWLWSAAAGEEAFEAANGFIGSPFGMLLMFGWTAALFYHLLNGIRHLAWDLGHGLELEQAEASGWGVVIGTGVLTVLAWIIGFIFL